jgi:hypothetical protein
MKLGDARTLPRGSADFALSAVTCCWLLRLSWWNNPQRLRDTRRLISWNRPVAPVCSFPAFPLSSTLFDHPEAQAEGRLIAGAPIGRTVAEAVNAAPASQGHDTREVLD